MTNKILMAEDEPGVRMLYTVATKRFGIEADIVASGAEAREKLSQNTYALFWTDNDMEKPNMGELLYTELRQGLYNGNQGIQIVICSGRPFDSIIDGRTIVLEKPITMSTLKSTIEEKLKNPSS